MKVIITGGAGFIGSHAVKYFVESGDDVLNIDKLTYASNTCNLKLCNFMKVDICDKDSLLRIIKDYKPEYLINFAAETHVDNSINSVSEFIKTNITGTTTIMDVCKNQNIPLCHISTDEVYGPANNRAFVETDNLLPMNPYSVTKAAADLMLSAYKNTYGLNYVIVRPSNNYGPDQHYEKFIPKLLYCIKQGKKFPLYGSGNQEREWTYVKDTAILIRKIITSSKVSWNDNAIYNLSSGMSYKNIEVIKKILDLYNQKYKRHYHIDNVVCYSPDRPGHDKKYWTSSKKLNDVVNYNYTTFEEGIMKTI